MSIPKIIHLCWFGRGEFPELAKMCIESWKTTLPEYEIKIWNEDNFDVNCNSYTKKAYKEEKWAFVSDYARLIILEQYGGIYMDTDLEVIRDFSKLLDGKKYVSSYVEGGLITAGFIACEKHHPYVKKIIEFYDNESIKIDNHCDVSFVMNPLIFTKIACDLYAFSLMDGYFENDEITIYPLDYFMPYKKIAFGQGYSKRHYRITTKTYTIHHDMSSWHRRKKLLKFAKAIVRLIVPQRIYIEMKIRKNQKELNRYR